MAAGVIARAGMLAVRPRCPACYRRQGQRLTTDTWQLSVAWRKMLSLTLLLAYARTNVAARRAQTRVAKHIAHVSTTG